jgi:NAD/NADP transhydrogenase alpha subunit
VTQPAPVPTTATVGVDAAVGQMKALLPAGADPGLMVGGAVGLALVGAAIKFGPSVLKARAEKAEREHEEKMKKLELEEKKAEKQDEQHGQCNAARMALEARVVAAEAKTSDLERKLAEVAARPAPSGAIDLGDFDPEELEDRLAKIEKALKPARAPKKK